MSKQALVAFVVDHAALLNAGVAVLALLVACVQGSRAIRSSKQANATADRALAESVQANLLDVQRLLLEEFDLLDTKLQTLEGLFVDANRLYGRYPQLTQINPQGFQLYEHNLDWVRHQRRDYEKDRVVAEKQLGTGQVKFQQRILGRVII